MTGPPNTKWIINCEGGVTIVIRSSLETPNSANIGVEMGT